MSMEIFRRTGKYSMSRINIAKAGRGIVEVESRFLRIKKKWKFIGKVFHIFGRNSADFDCTGILDCILSVNKN